MICKHYVRLTCNLFLAGFFFTSMAPESEALETLFNNLGQTQNGGSNVSNTQWPAQAFTTTSNGYKLSEVSLRIWNNSGTTGGFAIQIWDANGAGGKPGAQVGSAIYSGLAENLSATSDPANPLVISNLNFTLTANTNYYIVARGTSLNTGSLVVDCSGTNTTAYYIATSSGSSWVGPFTSANVYMRVMAVPEPSTLFMAGVGALTLCLAGRKRFVKAGA